MTLTFTPTQGVGAVQLQQADEQRLDQRVQLAWPRALEPFPCSPAYFADARPSTTDHPRVAIARPVDPDSPLLGDWHRGAPVELQRERCALGGPI